MARVATEHLTLAMILAAGEGTRLRPLTAELAKPLVPVGDEPAIAHVARRLRALAGSVPLVANVHHGRAPLERWLSANGIVASIEPSLLGTAGGLARACRASARTGAALVWNGDILADVDPVALGRAHHGRGAAATLVVRPRAPGEGTVGLGTDGRIVRLRGEHFGEEVRGGEFLGIHVVGATLCATLPDVGCLVGDVYLPALRRGERLEAWETECAFDDIGTPPAYHRANMRWLDACGLAAFVDATATIAGQVHRSCVGAAAVVTASISEVVVWPGAEVHEPLTRAIVTPRATVRL